MNPKIYFIQMGDDGPIKIGQTISGVKSRLKTLKTNCPYKLNILYVHENTVYPMSEREIHGWFKEDRLEGEWFNPSKKLISFIKEIKNGKKFIPKPMERIKDSEKKLKTILKHGKIKHRPYPTTDIGIKTHELLKRCGGYTGLARELDVALSYVYRLEKGTIPGKRLYRDIDVLYRENFK